MKRSLAIMVLMLGGLSSQASAQTAPPTYNPNWRDGVLITNYGFGLTFGLLFGDLTSIRFSRTGHLKQNTFFYVGFEGIAGHAFTDDCDWWGTSHFAGATLGFDYTFSRGTFTLYSEASYNYMANMMTPGVALGVQWALSGPRTGLGLQATQSAMALQLRQRFDGEFQAGVGMGIPFARAPLFPTQDNCTRVIEG